MRRGRHRQVSVGRAPPWRRLFECFHSHRVPVFSISSHIDISGYVVFIEARDLRFCTTLWCLISEAFNARPCFRHRIVDGVLLEYPRVHLLINLALDEESFSFADALYCGSFAEDYASIWTVFEPARLHPTRSFAEGWMIDCTMPCWMACTWAGC